MVETAYEYDAADRLSQITHNGFAYTFQRDGYGNTTAINVGTQNLIANTFAPGNGNLQSSNFGNGFKLGYLYDSYDRVNMVLKNDSLTYEYLYDARGNLAKITEYDQGSVKSINFYYDIGDRLIRQLLSDGSEIQYVYDNMDRPTRYVCTFANQSKSATADYSVDYRKHNTYMLSGGEITHAYDTTLNREFQTDINPIPLQDPTFRAERSFVNVLNAKTTTLVDTYYNHRRIGDVNSTLSQYHYTYDDNGNISSTTDINGNVTTYAYDQLNQLVRADDQKAGVSTVYGYDVGGNITTVTTYAYTTGTLGTETGSIAYDYGNTNWKDLLTGYDGQNMTYDAIGNPLTYRDGMNFTWEGRQLKSSIANSQDVEYTVEYTYNSNGIRTVKTVNGITTNYFLDGSTIIAQQTGSDVLWFLYDSDKTLVGFTYNDTAYYYMKNMQGDVTGIVDSSVNLVVEYTYDAWGKLLSITDNSADQVGQKNPFRYRGYYYDSETGLYYLNDRYYDPMTCRMLNANSMVGVGTRVSSYNMFAYCDNNPISRSDSSGQWFGLDDLIAGAVGAVAGVAAQFVSDALVSVASGEWKFSDWQTYAGAAVGGAIGGVVALYAGPIVGAATAAGASTLIGQTLENVTSGGTKRSAGTILLNAGTDTVIGAAAGKFLSAKVPGITTGRNSMAAVFSSGITKIRNGVASRMSAKVVGKGITASIISDSGATTFSALINYLKDAYESYEQEAQSSVPSGPMYWTHG